MRGGRLGGIGRGGFGGGMEAAVLGGWWNKSNAGTRWIRNVWDDVPFSKQEHGYG